MSASVDEPSHGASCAPRYVTCHPAPANSSASSCWVTSAPPIRNGGVDRRQANSTERIGLSSLVGRDEVPHRRHGLIRTAHVPAGAPGLLERPAVCLAVIK